MHKIKGSEHLDGVIIKSRKSFTVCFFSFYLFDWLERWTWNPEFMGSGHTQTTKLELFLASQLGHACEANWSFSGWDF